VSETTDDQPDMQPNQLKILMSTAAGRAEAAPGNIAPAGGNPLRSALAALDGAWVSPGHARTVFVENLEGAGTAVTKAFDAQAHHARDLAGHEPPKVDANDPNEGWKASTSRIASRASVPYFGGY